MNVSAVFDWIYFDFWMLSRASLWVTLICFIWKSSFHVQPNTTPFWDRICPASSAKNLYHFRPSGYIVLDTSDNKHHNHCRILLLYFLNYASSLTPFKHVFNHSLDANAFIFILLCKASQLKSCLLSISWISDTKQSSHPYVSSKV